MSKLVLYIACSLDGYIADKDGGISFLDEVSPTDFSLVYDDFYSSINTLIMGGKTFRQLTHELTPDNWPYMGKKCFVYTNQPLKKTEDVEAATLPPAKLLSSIRQTQKGDIWLMGGGEIIKLFLKDKLIDRYYIYVMPVLLGGGTPLFPADFPLSSLTLESTRKVGEMVEIIYNRRF